MKFFTAICIILLVLFAGAAVLTGNAQDASPTPEAPIFTNTPADAVIPPQQLGDTATPAVTEIAPIAATEAPATPIVVVEPAPVDPQVTTLYERLLTFAELLIAGLAALFGFTQYLHSSERKQTNAALADALPASVVQLLQWGAPLALKAAANTPTPIDDLALRNMLKTIGFEIQETASGYIVNKLGTKEAPPAA